MTRDDMEWLRRKDDEAKAQEARYLAEAKARAAERGRARSLEGRYYVDYPNILTLAEFATRMTELDTWR